MQPAQAWLYLYLEILSIFDHEATKEKENDTEKVKDKKSHQINKSLVKIQWFDAMHQTRGQVPLDYNEYTRWTTLVQYGSTYRVHFQVNRRVHLVPGRVHLQNGSAYRVHLCSM